MRIVGGKLKGRVLQGPASATIRPTSDRLRETIFNILVHRYGDPVAGARVLDLFAGTGAMAFEALSRGASSALLVDKSAEALALVRANLEALGLAGRAQVLRRDATRLEHFPAKPTATRFRVAKMRQNKYLEPLSDLTETESALGPSPDAEPFGLAFLDPPYGKGLVAPTLEALRDGQWLAREAVVVVEEAARAEVVIPEGYASIEVRTYADTQVLFLRAE